MTEFLTPIERHYATKWEQMTILDDPIFGAVMGRHGKRATLPGIITPGPAGIKD